MNYKSIIAAVALTCSSAAALADPFYLDVGNNFGGNANKAAGINTTGWINEMTYNYQSTTIVAGPAVNGASITTTGGFDGTLVSVQTNSVSGFLPSQAFGGPSNNGFNTGTGWGLTFKFALSGNLGPANSTSYDDGTIEFFYYPENATLASEFISLFTIDVSSTTNSLGGPVLNGLITATSAGSVNGVDAGDVLNFAAGSAKTLLANMAQITASIDYNTDFSQVTVTNDFDGLGNTKLEGLHNGSIRFAVPEPASIAVLGLGLLGLAGASRRRKS